MMAKLSPLVFTFLFAVVSGKLSGSQYTNSFRHVLLYGGDVISNMTVESDLGCTLFCVRSELCKGINFNVRTKFCSLVKLTGKESRALLHKHEDYVYIEKIFLEGIDQPVQSDGSDQSPGTNMNPGSSCKDLLSRAPSLTSGNYWISVLGTLIEVYCDMTVDGGGWTLVWSYTFTQYSNFGNYGNAVRPFPSWSVTGNIGVPTSIQAPSNLDDYNAMEFDKWKEIGNEFLIQSNINNWVSCKPGTGSLVMLKGGTLSCKIEKHITSNCGHISAPDKLAISNYGPGLKKSNENKWYYYFEGNAQQSVNRFPVHDPCATSNQNHKKGVTGPRGNIFLR